MKNVMIKIIHKNGIKIGKHFVSLQYDPSEASVKGKEEKQTPDQTSVLSVKYTDVIR